MTYTSPWAALKGAERTNVLSNILTSLKGPLEDEVLDTWGKGNCFPFIQPIMFSPFSAYTKMKTQETPGHSVSLWSQEKSYRKSSWKISGHIEEVEVRNSQHEFATDKS